MNLRRKIELAWVFHVITTLQQAVKVQRTQDVSPTDSS